MLYLICGGWYKIRRKKGKEKGVEGIPSKWRKDQQNRGRSLKGEGRGTG